MTAPTLPIVVAEIDKNKSERIVIRLDQFHGAVVIDCRTWFKDGDTFKPTKKGMSVSVRHLPALATGLQAALDRARELGLVAE